MKKNLMLRLCLILTVLLSLYSCIHDEVISSSDPSSTEYTNKSLWKQDERYITNVMKVYAENEAEIKKVNGIPYWNYATTVDSFDESFVAIPIIDNGKVTAVLKVPRHGKKIYFYYTHEESDLMFFQGLVFAKHKKAGMMDGSTAQTNGMACTRQWISMWFPDSESNPDPDTGAGHWESTSIIKCESTKDECIGIALPNGDCDLTGGTDGGYPYPGGGGEGNEPEEEDPCDKLKTKITGIEFKQKLQSLTNPANFALDHEVGFFEKNGQFFPAASDPCNYELKATTNVQCISGIMHTHPTAGCDGGLKDKTPSPGDIAVFLNIILPQAQSCLGNMKDAYSLTITPWGNYMLKYSNTNLPTNNNFNMDELFKIFNKQIQKLENKNLYTPDNVEKTFMKFIDDYMNVDGLEVYKVTENSSEKLDYDPATGTTTKTPCPNF